MLLEFDSAKSQKIRPDLPFSVGLRSSRVFSHCDWKMKTPPSAQLLQTKKAHDTHWATSQSDWLQFLLIFQPIRPVLCAESRHCRIEQGDGSTNGSVDLGGCRNDGIFDDAHWAVYGRRTKPRLAESIGFRDAGVHVVYVSYHSSVKKSEVCSSETQQGNHTMSSMVNVPVAPHP